MLSHFGDLILSLIFVFLVYVCSAVTRSEEIEHVKCQICKIAMQEASRLTSKLERNEEELSDSIEELCSPKSNPGQWLKSIDLQQVGKTISVIRQEKQGNCGNECLTAQRACSKSLKGREELIEISLCWIERILLFLSGHLKRWNKLFPGIVLSCMEQVLQLLMDGATLFVLTENICKVVCSVTPQPLKGERKDEAFKAKSVGNALSDFLSGDADLQEALDALTDKSGSGKTTKVESKVKAKPLNTSSVANTTANNSEKMSTFSVPLKYQEKSTRSSSQQSQTQKNDTLDFLEDFLKKHIFDLTREKDGREEIDTIIEIEHVQCNVCKLAVHEAWSLVRNGSGKKSTNAIMDGLSKVCSADSRQGRWITKLDLQQNGNYINVVRHNDYGECRRECLTIQQACVKGFKGRENLLLNSLKASSSSDVQTSFCQAMCIDSVEPLTVERLDESFEPKSLLETVLTHWLDNLDEPEVATPLKHRRNSNDTAKQRNSSRSRSLGNTTNGEENLSQSLSWITSDVIHAMAILAKLLFGSMAMACIVFVIIFCVFSYLSKRKSKFNQRVDVGVGAHDEDIQTWETSCELVALLASQEERIRSMERISQHSSRQTLQEALRAKAMAESLRDAAESRILKPCNSRKPIRLSSSSFSGRASVETSEFSSTRCVQCGRLSPEYACSGCSNAKYCSSQCQRSHWRVHKETCIGILQAKQKVG